MQAAIRLRQVLRLLGGIAVTLVGGTFGFHATLDESWFHAFYRAIVTATNSTAAVCVTAAGIELAALTLTVLARTRNAPA